MVGAGKESFLLPLLNHVRSKFQTKFWMCLLYNGKPDCDFHMVDSEHIITSSSEDEYIENEKNEVYQTKDIAMYTFFSSDSRYFSSSEELVQRKILSEQLEEVDHELIETTNINKQL